MTKAQRLGRESQTRTFSIKMPASADEALERYCDRTASKKGELLARIVRWFIAVPNEVQMYVKEGITPISARHFAAMLRDLADDIERRAAAGNALTVEESHKPDDDDSESERGKERKENGDGDLHGPQREHRSKGRRR